MYRTLKFRAWDTVEKKWLFGYEYPNLGGFNLTGEVVLCGEISSVPLLKWNDIAIMQYANIQDKNGKDIYDGDILKYENEYGRIHYHRVFAVKGGLAINTHSDDFAKEKIVFYEAVADMQTAGWIEQCEVIGNIHENPELLNHAT